MNTTRHIAFVLPALLALAACKPQSAETAAPAAPQPAAEQPASPQPVAEAPAPGAVPAPMALPEAPASSSVVPIPSLPGKFSDGDSVLELYADGRYVQTLTVAGSEMQSDGHWAADGDNAILLDPNSKESADTRFDVLSRDLLRANGHEFKRVPIPKE